MVDENDNEYRAKLLKAAATDEGYFIIKYIKAKILEECDFNSIDETITDEEAGREFKRIKKIKSFLENLLIFNNSQE